MHHLSRVVAVVCLGVSWLLGLKLFVCVELLIGSWL
jgi:hypothetical protein